MILRWSLQPNAYHDSVKLMRVSEALGLAPGVARGAVVMATPLNLELLADDGLLPDGLQATPEDLLVTVLAEDEEAAEGALAGLDGLLAPARSAESAAPSPRTLEAAAGDANLAVIAVPGQYATLEALAALRSGLHVFLFSDNVSVADEVRLKRLAVERDLLMMGPDCGTAIIGGVGLGFANRVQPGPVGIVGASGTGIQQLCCLLDEANVGIAQAIGTGGRDLSPAVDGMMTRRALRALDTDEHVEVIALISKTAGAGTAARLDRDLRRLSKPAVVCLLGESPESSEGIRYAPTLTDAASKILDVLSQPVGGWEEPELPTNISRRPGKVYGLFAGGTLCDEAGLVLDSLGAPHHLIDLGADEYTRGRAHPMIDPRLRTSMLADVSERADVGAVLLDVILGDLAHPDPAGALLAPIDQFSARGVPIVATLIGTRADPQGLDTQRERLESAGAIVVSSNAAAARLAGSTIGDAA